MKVAVNKRVLFDFLKKQLNENRMPGGDHGGRLIHPFNVQSPNSDPFGSMKMKKIHLLKYQTTWQYNCQFQKCLLMMKTSSRVL